MIAEINEQMKQTNTNSTSKKYLQSAATTVALDVSVPAR
jgi:hypothetical protein